MGALALNSFFGCSFESDESFGTLGGARHHGPGAPLRYKIRVSIYDLLLSKNCYG
jgi:hypothetical protein